MNYPGNTRVAKAFTNVPATKVENALVEAETMFRTLTEQASVVTNTDGAGIELAQVKRIVEVHGDKFRTEPDELGKGSALLFTLGDRWEFRL